MRGKVLGGNEIDKVLLSAFLLQSISIESLALIGSGRTYVLEDSPDGWVCMF